MKTRQTANRASEKTPPREAILEAALQIIAENTISRTRMRQIADRAGMSQGNLHYYFPSKAALFQSLLDDMLAMFSEERRSQLADSDLPTERKLECFLDQMKGILLERRHLMDVYYDFWVQGTRDPKIRRKMQGMYARYRKDIAGVVEEGVQSGAFDPTHAPLIPALLVSLMQGATLQYLMDEEAFDLDAYFDAAHTLILKLLLNREGR